LSITNCGGCGQKCDTARSTGASCNAATCSYTSCASGWANCNTTAPDTDGCECSTPACCGAACQTAHSNGVGQTFYDCVSQGTYNQTQALEACAAFAPGGPCIQGSTFCGLAVALFVCNVGSSSCTCWEYQGPNPGAVYANASSNVCSCSTASGLPPWN
jgi:hypothetical protein